MDQRLQMVSLSEGDVQEAVRRLLPEIAHSDAQVVNDVLRSMVALHGNEAYATLFQALFHLSLDADEAKAHWKRMLGHHHLFRKRLGTEVDFRVSCLDYLTRVTGLLMNPTVIEVGQLEKLKNETITDELTRLFNRRHFDQMLEVECKRAKRYQGKLSLILFDIDHFKALNDRFGHTVGDQVLRQMGEVIGRAVREIDYPCRYGGEEFAIIAPRTDQQGALILAERVRSGIERLVLPSVDGVVPRVTVSGGIVSMQEEANRPDELIQRADAALYQAKRNGRNRIELHAGERRRSRRVEVELITICTILPQVRQVASTSDLSVDGFGLKASEPMAPGSNLEFEMALKPTRSLRAFGQVRYLKKNEGIDIFRYGVSIFRMPDQDRTLYRKYLTDCFQEKLR